MFTEPDDPGQGTADPEDMTPAFLQVSASEFGARPGRMLAELASGACLEVTDMRMGRRVGFISMSQELPPSLRKVAHMLPDAIPVIPCPELDEDAELAPAGRSA